MTIFNLYSFTAKYSVLRKDRHSKR